MKTMISFSTALTLAASSVAAQDVTLTYMMWDPDQLEVEQAAIAEFEAANSGVKVEVEAMPPSDYWPKLSAMAAAGDLPDVFAMSSGFVKGWAAADNLADLSEVTSGTDLSVFYEGALTPGIVGGMKVAFPQNWVAPVLYFNRDMFDAAGVEYPQADWTYDDFRAAAKALTLDTNGDGQIDQWGHWLYGRYSHVDTWVFRNGGRYLNEDESGLELNDAAVNTLKFLTDLVLVDKVAPMPQEMEGIRQQDVFPLGMSAMWVDGSWNIANVRSVADPSMNWGIAQVPMGPDATERDGRCLCLGRHAGDLEDQRTEGPGLGLPPAHGRCRPLGRRFPRRQGARLPRHRRKRCLAGTGPEARQQGTDPRNRRPARLHRLLQRLERLARLRRRRRRGHER